MKTAYPTFAVALICFLWALAASTQSAAPAQPEATQAKPQRSKPRKPSVDPKATTARKDNDFSREYNQHVKAIRQRPWEEQPFVDFANWLENHDKARARLVRVQLQLAQMQRDDPRHKKLSQEAAQLIEKNKAAWTKSLAALGDRAEIELEAGLVDSVELKDASDKDVALLETIPELRVLRLSSPQLALAGFECLSRFANLDSLAIDGKQPIDQASLAQLEKLPPWSEIRLYIKDLDRNAVQAMNVRRVAKLDKLNAEQRHSAGIRFLRGMAAYHAPYGKPHTRAELGQSDVEDVQMPLLAFVPELEVVDISESDVTTKGIANLASLKDVKDLGLWDTKVESIAPLAGLTKLEKLGIFPEFDTKMGDAGLEGLQNFVNLQELFLNDESISDEAVKRLAGLIKLRNLQITVGTLKSEDSLAALSGLTNLRLLDFQAANIGDEPLKYLAGLRQLESLSISVSKGTGAGFRHLSGLAKLKNLYVSGQGVTDEALDQLGSLKNLMSIMAQESAVTVSGAQRLAALLPHVTIILDEHVVKSPRESREFHRERLSDSVSVLLPVEWTHNNRAAAGSIRVLEDGWERINSWSGGIVGPLEIEMSRDVGSGSANAAVMAGADEDEHPIIRKDFLRIAGSKDTASCIYQNNSGQHLACAAKVGNEFIVLDCEAPPARFAEFEPLFLFVAKSIRISDDAAQHAAETVNVRTDELKPN